MYEIHIIDKANNLSWQSRRLYATYLEAEAYATRLAKKLTDLNMRAISPHIKGGRVMTWIVFNQKLTTIQDFYEAMEKEGVCNINLIEE